MQRRTTHHASLSFTLTDNTIRTIVNVRHYITLCFSTDIDNTDRPQAYHELAKTLPLAVQCLSLLSLLSLRSLLDLLSLIFLLYVLSLLSIG